ncbi:RimJ/RimL family protein N-acetyltransferase [Streptomyces sp. DSM 41037]|uniref:GNAT family N-acetyltransferase n=1 Tax=Streptomyces sp. DSM 41037 TaxID=2817710 RepID=UPI00277FC0BD|nr:GNAT family protein [Streptomyces sp. DSM 41037]MDQ0293751.1 RimJ/RimL family protein N-acetyltransferase [Streptomyces sp. DSM 41037]
MYAIPLTPTAELRPLEPWQAPEFLAHIDRARAHTDRWIPWATYSTDLDSARATLQSYADKQAADRGRVHGIWQEGTLVGGVMFVHFDAASGTCEIGVWSEPAGEGHGLVTAAVRHLLDHAFVTRGLHRAEWRTNPLNTRSRSVARRLGMTLDGTLRRSATHHGTRIDIEVWSLLSHEWEGTASGTDPARADGLPR